MIFLALNIYDDGPSMFRRIVMDDIIHQVQSNDFRSPNFGIRNGFSFGDNHFLVIC